MTELGSEVGDAEAQDSPNGNPWCSTTDVSRNPGGCSDLTRIPLRSAETGLYPKASTTKIAKAWTEIVFGIIKVQDRLTPAENQASDAILMHIQGALLALGFVPVEHGIVEAKAEYVSQLVPNTSALARYWERKHCENPKVKQFAALYHQAKVLAEEAEVLAPTISFKANHQNRRDAQFQVAANRYTSVEQAIVALRKFEQLNVSEGRLIVITDMDRFLDSLSVIDPEARRYWASLQGFIMEGNYPIYLNGKLLPLDVIDDLLRQQGPVPAVYGLAGIVAHEYWHIQGLDENAVSQKELALLERFKKAGLLGPDAQATRYIAAVQQQCDELQAHPEALIERIKMFSILAPTIRR